MHHPFDIGGQRRMITTSVGIASSVDGDNPDALLKKADGALYVVKRVGKKWVGALRAGRRLNRR